MLLVKTKISLSKIHGIGLFAAEFIPKGTEVWKFKKGFDLEFSEKEIYSLGLSQQALEQFLNYCYRSSGTGKYMLCSDDARFVNHSENPNIKGNGLEGELDTDIALYDILIGNEFTYNYITEDADYYRKFGVKLINALFSFRLCKRQE